MRTSMNTIPTIPWSSIRHPETIPHEKLHQTTFQPRINASVSKISSFQSGGSKANAIADALIYMIVKDNLLLNTIDKVGFKYYSSVVTPLYKVPKRTAMTTAIDQKWEVLSVLMKEKFLQISSFTLTTDIWTESMTSQSFLGSTVHFLDKDRLTSVVLDTVELNERHTSEYIQRIFESLCTTWNIALDKVTAVVTDNGANILKAACDTFGSIRHLPCIAHSLNLVLTRVIGESQILKDLIVKIKTIVTFFKHTNPADELRKSQSRFPQLRLIQDVPTRWNSTFYMLERFLVLINPVSSVLLKLPQSPPMLTATEVAMRILQPAEVVSKELSGQNYVTSSKIIPMIYCLKKATEKVETNLEIGETLKNEIVKELNRRFTGIESNSLLAIAMLLDPRFKRLHFLSALSCAKGIEKINTLLKQCKSNESRDSKDQHPNDQLMMECCDDDGWRIHAELVNHRKNYDTDSNTSGGLDVDLKQYLGTETIPLKANPIKFWYDRKENTLRLSLIALKYLSIVATSVPCERLFSMAGNVEVPNRNRLSGQHLSRVLFLKSLEFDKWRI